MLSYIDQLDRTIDLKNKPERIISLVPSLTELLFDLQLEKEVIGITKFCVHPDSWFRSKTRVGGTKNLNLDLIRSMSPDLIFANKEENDQAQIDILAREFPVWISDIATIPSALLAIQKIGDITGRSNVALSLSSDIERYFSSLHFNFNHATCLYLIWKNPYMSAGTDTFIHSMLSVFGLQNAIQETRYPVLSDSVLRKLTPNFIFLSSEPYPFKTQHVEELQRICPESRIFLVDGEMFSWYGSRMLKVPDYLSHLYDEIKRAS